MDASRLDVLLQGWRRRRPPGADAAGTRFVTLADVVVRASVTGDGPATIVFVPDPPNVIEHYDGLVRALAPQARVVCLDLPGFGFSHPGAGFDFTPARYVEVVATVLERLGFAPYVLVFSCVAGLIAVALAADHPHLVSRLVVVQCGSWSEQVRWVRRVDAAAYGIVGTPVVGQLALALGKRWNARHWYEAALPRGASTGEFLEPALAAFRAGACFCLASTFQAFVRAAPREVRGVTQPALVLWGARDRTHRATDRRSLAAQLPHAAWVEFERAGHFPELEEAERFRDLLCEFCRLPGGGR